MGHPPRLISKGLRPHSIPFELQTSTQSRAAKTIFRTVNHCQVPRSHILSCILPRNGIFRYQSKWCSVHQRSAFVLWAAILANLSWPSARGASLLPRSCHSSDERNCLLKSCAWKIPRSYPAIPEQLTRLRYQVTPCQTVSRQNNTSFS